MELQLHIPSAGGETGEGAVPFIRRLVVSTSGFVGVSGEEAIGRLVIADEENFGAAVHEQQGKASRAPSYIDNELHKAVAKTIPSQEGGHVTDTIVVRDFVIALIGKASSFVREYVGLVVLQGTGLQNQAERL